MKKLKLNRLEIFTILFLIASSIFLIIKYYYEDLTKKKAKYQEIKMITDNSFTMCINGNEYIFWAIKNHFHKTLELTAEGKTIKCNTHEVNYDETQLPNNINKQYIINRN